MAAVFGTLNEAQIVGNAQNRLRDLRSALNAVHDYYLWLSQYAAADLEAAPASMAAADATALLSAFADADQLHNLYVGGALGGSYTLPYNFSASQRTVMGPVT